MARRDYSQLSLADALLGGKKRKKKRLDQLAEIDALIDWQPIDAVLAAINSAAKGAGGYPPLCLFKALLLSLCYNLPDPKLEDALADRLSFRKFCGFPADAETPDETTFVRFRKTLRGLGLFGKLFAAINQQLDTRKLFVKQGTLIDAAIVEAGARRPPVREGEVSTVDPDAGFTKKNGESHFGCKMHAGVDEGPDLIRELEGTSADINDCLVFKGLVSGGEQSVCAGKACGSEDHRKWLADHGLKDRLMHKAQKNRPLTNWQIWFNKAVAPIRAAVERPFGIGKRSYGLGRARYRGLARVQGHFFVFAMAYNLRRALTIIEAREAAAA